MSQHELSQEVAVGAVGRSTVINENLFELFMQDIRRPGAVGRSTVINENLFELFTNKALELSPANRPIVLPKKHRRRIEKKASQMSTLLMGTSTMNYQMGN